MTAKMKLVIEADPRRDSEGNNPFRVQAVGSYWMSPPLVPFRNHAETWHLPEPKNGFLWGLRSGLSEP